MFKRFLKFFRGDDEAPDEPFEGSYLDHLLGQVKPVVVSQLEEEPDHDPLLLVVVGILRYTMINAWSPRLRAPLVDSQSPGKRPIPSAVSETTLAPAMESATTAEFDAVGLAKRAERDRLEAEQAEQIAPGDSEDELAEPEIIAIRDDEEAGAAEDGEAEAADGDEPAPDAVVESLDAPDSRSLRKTEEIDVSEIRAATAGQTIERETVEMDAIDPTIEIDPDNLFEVQGSDERPRIDGEEVLQAGRMFLGLLIENDRLPVELQLSVGETTVARDLLLGYFVGNTDFEEKARRLLTLVEQKFSEGLFSQARILLQLFHTDEQTRINNDRNLFYEDMILRLGIRRRHRLSTEELKRFDTLLAEAKSSTGARALTDWLSEKCLIRFQTFNRDPEQVASWKAVVGATTREGGEETFLKYLPPRRWRPVGNYPDLDVVEQINRHVSVDTAREYVISQIKTCYFVLRAVGDTGLEGFLDTFFDWAHAIYDLDATTLMPQLYKRSMMDPEPMTTILRDLYDEYFEERTTELVESWSDAQLETAFYGALATFADCDLGEIAPGYYDIGSFVYDELFAVKYPSAEFPFKIHRLT